LRQALGHSLHQSSMSTSPKDVAITTCNSCENCGKPPGAVHCADQPHLPTRRRLRVVDFTHVLLFRRLVQRM
jgi:hypothetical protein